MASEIISGNTLLPVVRLVAILNLAQVLTGIQLWKEDHNEHRPHSTLANITPAEFASKMRLEKLAA
ncbi:integrase core domain-containing protein [Mesorhizobium sp. INR15]|uniref:integrase core domain-containing protein n=1 Tax=Mesorhizobium sp. INR15 TaxID=2654248 RepID=UPI0018964554|nr:integrase core domain-containing protein [Mesorhizobium sp. INR15]QPC95681.1 transposase [Mesorhizobium sp. INR15]QPC96062.1 transposase [Mesorhizobium sp. INR15]